MLLWRQVLLRWNAVTCSDMQQHVVAPILCMHPESRTLRMNLFANHFKDVIQDWCHRQAFLPLQQTVHSHKNGSSLWVCHLSRASLRGIVWIGR